MYYDSSDYSASPVYGLQHVPMPWWRAPAWHAVDSGYNTQASWHRQSQEYNSRNAYLALGANGASARSQSDALSEEPREIVLVNSPTSGAHDSLCADAASADLVAFDAEWRPDCYEGADHPISVLQLAFPASRRVYVVQLGRYGGKLPDSVSMMLVNPEVTKVGFAVDHGDIDKFARTGIAVTRGSVVDVQDQCWKRLLALGMSTAYGRLGLKKAAEKLLGYRMNKDKRLSCSDWASTELTPEQVRYAGLDAWVTLRLYYSTQYIAR